MNQEKEYGLIQWEPLTNVMRKTLTVDPVLGDAVITRSGLTGIVRYVVCFLTLNYRGHKE